MTEEDLNRVSDNVTAKINESIIAELLDTIKTLNQTLTDRLLYLELQFVTLCNITSANWRRIAYLDTTQEDPCPTGLRTVTPRQHVEETILVLDVLHLHFLLLEIIVKCVVE